MTLEEVYQSIDWSNRNEAESRIKALSVEDQKGIFFLAFEDFFAFLHEILEPWELGDNPDPSVQMVADLYGEENLLRLKNWDGENVIVASSALVTKAPEFEVWRVGMIMDVADAKSQYKYNKRIREEHPELNLPDRDIPGEVRGLALLFGGLPGDTRALYESPGIVRKMIRISPEFRSRWIAHLRETMNTIPVLDAVREGDFKKCPKMGVARSYASADLLSAEGIVVPYQGLRYRLRYTWHDVAEGSRLVESASGATLAFEQTTDAATPQTKGGELRIFGRGQSQQEDTAPFLDGNMPVCLATFNRSGVDYTWCLMAHLGDDGLPIVGWVEGSCT